MVRSNITSLALLVTCVLPGCEKDCSNEWDALNDESVELHSVGNYERAVVVAKTMVRIGTVVSLLAVLTACDNRPRTDREAGHINSGLHGKSLLKVEP